MDQIWRNARALGLLVMAAISLAACATPRYETGKSGMMASAIHDTTRGGSPRPGSTIGRDGKPVKRSTLDRILAKLEALDARVAA